MELLDREKLHQPDPDLENPELEALLDGRLEDMMDRPFREAVNREAFVSEMEVLYPPEIEKPKGRRVRPEAVLGLIAALSAGLLLIMVVLCLPYFGRSEDPESYRHDPSYLMELEPLNPTILEPTIPEEEPENPTIPPDPNPYDRYDFQYNRRNYLLLQDLPSRAGVDVSSYQGDIDWETVARSGIEFAIIRLGFRGYESGKLVEDEYARQNLEGAAAAGLDIGVYFFSQALDIEEAQEEIDFMLDILGEQSLDLPIILDWEMPAETARTRNMDARTLTDIQLYFCLEMDRLGYQPMIYFNWHQADNLYYLHELEGAPFWLALYQDRMTYPFKVEFWQYTDRGRVPGINGNVDLNVQMLD